MHRVIGPCREYYEQGGTEASEIALLQDRVIDLRRQHWFMEEMRVQELVDARHYPGKSMGSEYQHVRKEFIEEAKEGHKMTGPINGFDVNSAASWTHVRLCAALSFAINCAGSRK